MSNVDVQPPGGPMRLGHDAPLADWLVALSHDSPFERPHSSAAWAGPSPPPAEVPSLLSLLKDVDPDVRLRAVTALGQFAGQVQSVLPALWNALQEEALREGDKDVRAEAVRALLRGGPLTATEVPALIDALHSALDVVRFHAAITLGDFGHESQPAEPALTHASLWDEEPAVRVAAAMALWKIDKHKLPLVVDVLGRALGDANELICWIAAECLGHMGPAAREAVPALQQALQRHYRLALVTTSVKLALERIDRQPSAGAG